MRTRTMDIIVLTALGALTTAAVWSLTGDHHTDHDRPPAVEVVVSHLDLDRVRRVGLSTGHFQASENPLGGGTVVYAGRVAGEFPQKPVWLRWKGSVYALNGSAKSLTPGLPWGWPRPEAGSEDEWRGSGLVAHGTHDIVSELYPP